MPGLNLDALLVILGAVVLIAVVGLLQRARPIHSVSWVGLTGSEQLFVLLSEHVEKSYQALSAAETSG